jgi:hypothetical protein
MRRRHIEHQIGLGIAEAKREAVPVVDATQEEIEIAAAAGHEPRSAPAERAFRKRCRCIGV